MSDINWAGLNRGPNVFGEALEGYQRGSDHRRQTQRDNLFAERQDFEMGQARRQQALQDQERARKAKVGSAVATGDYAGARTAAEGDFDLLEGIAKLDADQRKRAHETADDIGGFAVSVKGIPYEQRKAVIAQAKPTLVGYGMKEADVDTFDPTDANLDARIAEATDLKTALEQANRVRDDERAAAQFGETKRHNSVTEGQGAARVGLAKQREGRVAAGGGRGGGSGLPPPPSGWSR